MINTSSKNPDGAEIPNSKDHSEVIYHHNIVKIKSSALSNVQWVPGQYVVSGGQSSGTDPKVTKIEGGWEIDVYCGRQGTASVAQSFNAINLSSEHMWTPIPGDDEPEELNFYVGVRLEIGIYGIPRYVDVYFAQGNYLTVNNWWIGSPILANNDSRIIPIMTSANETLNILEVTNDHNDNVFTVSQWFQRSDVTRTKKDWLRDVSDDLFISQVNLPGTHDSAAIQGWIWNPYACHYASLTEQMKGGIRLFDIRLKVKMDEDGQFYFQTCHSNKKYTHETANEFQPFVSAMDEFAAYLKLHSSEFLVVSLKIDDWDGYDISERDAVYDALVRVLQPYSPIIQKTPQLPQVGLARGSIYLLNRITDDDRFGVPLPIKNNTTGLLVGTAAFRGFNYFVQDWYTELPDDRFKEAKFEKWSAASQYIERANMVFNFATATHNLAKVMILGYICEYFGDTAVGGGRPSELGWSLFDFEFTEYQSTPYGGLNVVDLFVASNFRWVGYEQAFEVNNTDRAFASWSMG